MARQQGSLKLSSNIEPNAAAPLDARTVVQAKNDLTVSSNFPYPYVGMVVSVQDEGKMYLLLNKDVTNIDNWKVVGSGEIVEIPDTYINNLFV